MLKFGSDATIRVLNQGSLARRLGDHTLPAGVWTTVPARYFAAYAHDLALRWDFTPFREQLRSQSEDGRPSFDFWCPLSAVDGYGRHALDIWKGLLNLNVDATLKSVGFEDVDTLDPGILAERARNQSLPPAKVAVVMTIAYDPRIFDHQSVHKLAITQFETDHVPEKYVENVNRCDHLITTSAFQPAVWRKSGLKIPISVLTPGVDTDWFAYKERPKDGKFKVLILGALSGRKNVPGAIRIFQAASQDNPDWRLTIKTRAGLIEKEAQRLADLDKRIEIVNGDAPARWIRDQLYYGHDVLLWPSKGEGVGLPPLEAMATGMEVVVADNSGMRDYVNDRWCWPIRTASMAPASGPDGWSADHINRYGDVGNWWIPDEGHGRKQLERCFNAWYDGKGKGKEAADYVRSHHTVAIQAQSVLDIVKEYL